MPKKRIIPTVAITLAALLAAWTCGKLAAAPAPAPKAPDSAPVVPGQTEAEKLIETAVIKLVSLESVSAKITQKVSMLGQKFSVEGRYLKAPNDRLCVELKVVGLPDSKGTFYQVCDGKIFWDYQQVFENQIYRKLDAGQILAKLRTADIDNEMRQQIFNQLGFAGPEVLLIGLRKAVRFDQLDEETLDGRPVWKLTGTWTSHEGLYAPNSQPLPLNAPLPSYVPSLVSIYLGKDNYWPYVVKLMGQRRTIVEDTRPMGPDGRRIGPRTSIQKPLLTDIELIYSDVELNVPIPDTLFKFQAPQGAPVEDDTKRILDGLEQAVMARAAQKKAEAAKGEEPVIKEPLEVPKSAPAPAPLPKP